MWRALGIVVKSSGHVVIRMGSRSDSPERPLSKLTASGVTSGREMSLVATNESVVQRRQTDSFRPGSKGLGVELDAVYQLN